MKWRFLIILWISTKAFAGPIPLDIVPTKFWGSDSIQKYIHKIVAYDGKDSRRTEDIYAKEHLLDPDKLKIFTSATGKISCGGFTGGANLVLDRSTIVTSNHIPCEANVDGSQCTFTYRNESGMHDVQVSGVAAKGSVCGDRDVTGDWIMLRLSSPANGVTPYKISPSFVNHIVAPKNVILVGDHSKDFCRRNRSSKCVRDLKYEVAYFYDRFVADCKINYVATYAGVATQHASNCPAGQGTSGSALIDEQLDEHILIGIVATSPSAVPSIGLSEKKSGQPIIAPFSTRKHWYTLSTPVTGALAEAIYKAAGSDL